MMHVALAVSHTITTAKLATLDSYSLPSSIAIWSKYDCYKANLKVLLGITSAIP